MSEEKSLHPPRFTPEAIARRNAEGWCWGCWLTEQPREFKARESAGKSLGERQRDEGISDPRKDD